MAICIPKTRSEKKIRESLVQGYYSIKSELEENHSKMATAIDTASLARRILLGMVFLLKCEELGISESNTTILTVSGHNPTKLYLKLLKQTAQLFHSDLFSDITLKSIVHLDGSLVRNVIENIAASCFSSSGITVETFCLGNVYELYHSLECVNPYSNSGSRKSQGIYYTPNKVIEDIVGKSVGVMLIENAQDSRFDYFQQKGKPVTILDPACGAGAFLAGTLQYLISYFNSNGTTFESEGCIEILKQNIYGVDIDYEAVELCKINLLLCLVKAVDRVDIATLPNLENNIKCGNSLISTNIIDMNNTCNYVEELKPFNWESEFTAVFENGGFDVVIGNPPYLSYSGRHAVNVPEVELSYYRNSYSKQNWLTSQSLFIERSIRFLSKRYTGFIVPDQIGHLNGYKQIRRIITGNSNLKYVRYWGEDVFNGAVTPALSFITDNTFSGEAVIVKENGTVGKLKVTRDNHWTRETASNLIPDHIIHSCFSLGNLVGDPGVHTGNCAQKLIHSIAERPDLPPVLEGKQIGRYTCALPTKSLLYDYVTENNEYYSIRSMERYRDSKFLIRQTAAHPIVGPRKHSEYFRNSLLALYSPSNGIDVRYLAGILNSSLMKFLYQQQVLESKQKAFPQVKVKSLRILPIRSINFSEYNDILQHDYLVELVQNMLELSKESSNSSRSDFNSAQINILDQQIDTAVHRLYELDDCSVELILQTVAN